jgi:DDE family transposase
MLVADNVKDYFLLIPSNIRHSLASSNAIIPFEYDNESFFQAYRCLYQLWVKRTSQKAIIEKENISKHKLKEWEDNFEQFGAAGLLQNLHFIDVNPLLERLIILIKSARPHESAALALRLADALEIPHVSLELIRQIQRCHGFGQNMNEKDIAYYQGLQHIFSSVIFFKANNKTIHDAKNRRHTFIDFDNDYFQQRIELFKELSEIKQPGQTRAIIKKFGIAPSRFYTLKARYMLYGVWGLCDLVQTTKCGEVISPDLELQIIEERLINPTLSPARMLEKLDLRCSTSNMKKIYARWGLSRFKKPVPLRGIIPEAIPKSIERPSSVRQSAKTLFPRLIEEKNLKIHSEFNELLKRLGRRDVIISNPGAIIMAPFINQLGIVEALHSYGPQSRLSGPITNQIIVNVLRIIVGFPSIHDFTLNSDRSVAVGSGLPLNPAKTRFYEFFDKLRFRHLEDLRNDAGCRARELGIIDGKEIAVDYHCDSSDSRYPHDKMFSKAPDKAGDLVYAHRPQILWDSATNSIINIAYCQGNSRAPTALYNFCENNLFKIIDPEVIKEIYADSEYTGERQLIYLVDQTATNVTMCLKQNPKIRRWREEALKTGHWIAYGETYQIATKDFNLAETGKPFRFVVKKHNVTGEIRCFGSTHVDYSALKILEQYHLRWPVETGIKDLITNYFLNNPPGTSPEKVESHYYCIMLARLAVDYFLSLFMEQKLKQSEEWDCVLSTLRTTIFSNQSCRLCLDDSGDLLLTYLDGDKLGIKAHLSNLLKQRTEIGVNKVPWWGNRGVQVCFVNQHEHS